MTQDYLGFVTALQRQYGDTVYMHLGPLHDYSLFHPEQMRELLVGAHADLIRWERGTEVFAAVHGQSVLVVEGETWARKRRVCCSRASQPKRVAGFSSAMVDAGEQALSAWPEDAEARAGFELDFEQAMTGLTMDVILRTLFSSAANDEARLAEDAVRVLSQEAMREFYWPASAPLWAPWKSAKRRALGALDGLIRGHIAAPQARAGVWRGRCRRPAGHAAAAAPGGWQPAGRRGAARRVHDHLPGRPRDQRRRPHLVGLVHG